MAETTMRDVRPLGEAWQAEVDKVLASPSIKYLAARAVFVPADRWTEAEAKDAASRLVVPDSVTIQREPDGRPEVWGQDLFEGQYWVIYLVKSEA
jgi:hypothetical protein